MTEEYGADAEAEAEAMAYMCMKRRDERQKLCMKRRDERQISS